MSKHLNEDRADALDGRTPTPWRVGVSSANDIACIDATNPETGGTIEVCEVWDPSSAKQLTTASMANAAFIVRACNSHDDLLSALKLYRYAATLPYGDPLHQAHLNDADKQMRLAIAKAEG